MFGPERRRITGRWENHINRVVREMFGPEMEEDGSRKKLHKNELHSLYSSPNIVRAIK
jgi:hypothetical protein